ncbi:MAG: DEAD/DEAH box helicase family protein, partial [Minicystis sp.]
MARPGKSGLDYRITDHDEIGAGGEVAKTRANLEAITLLKHIESEGRKATAAEQAVLVKYVGWGGLSSAFRAYDQLGRDLRAALTDEEYDSARASTPNAHYTSKEVVDAVWAAVKRLGVDHGRVLEPAMGVGHFFGLMPRELAGATTWAGVELDTISGRIAQQLYQSAQIQITGFEAAQLPDNFFDLAIGNPPFGNYGIHDPAFRGRPKALTSAIHNYFFAKTLDKVKPGGVVAFITSHYTMDAKDSTVRSYLAQQATLLGAVRLPNTAFKKNAGTEVVTDILFLQKREKPITRADFTKIDLQFERTDSIMGGAASINEYFIRHPEMVLGTHSTQGSMYSDKEYTVEPSGDLAGQLAAAVKKLPKNVVDTAPAKDPRTDKPEEFVPAPDHVKPFAYARQDGKLMARDGARMVSMDHLPAETKRRIVGLMGVRDALRETMRTMLNVDMVASDADVKAAQAKLTKAYDAFVKKFGYIHDVANFRAFGNDPDKPLLLSLEEWDGREKTATKAAIFTKRTLSPATPITHVDTPGEGLILSLNVRGRVDWNYLRQITGQEIDALQASLKGQVFEAPGGGWEVADAYLSGDVRQKLDDARAAAALDSKFAPNVEALEKVQPEPLGPADVKARLGANWIPASDVEHFVNAILDERQAVTVKYVPVLSAWTVQSNWDVKRNTNNNTKWGTTRASAVDLLEDSLNGRFASVYDTTRDGSRVLNANDTMAARAKQADLEAYFSKWIWEDAPRADRLLAHYNRHFNNVRLREFDGQHLTLPGMAVDVTLRPHQKSAIWRTLQTPNTLLAHVVGAGKTFVMIGSAMEKRRLGLATKPMVVVPNHLVEQTAKEFLRMYPAANVLMTTKADFEAGARKKLMARIATGDWDAVIVAHSSFGKVPVSNERFNDFLQKQIDELEEYLRAAKADAGSGRDKSVKELEKAKKRLVAKLKSRRKEDQQDKTVTWEETGVDALYVDEAHLFKNLFFPTRMTRIAGLPNSESDRAFDMFLKVRHVQEVNNGGGVTFATGTPISNTMAEMYTMQRYLGSADLEARGLQLFDAWAKQFGTAVTSLELAPEGRGFRMRSRFAKFTNWAELAKLYRSFADVMTADKLKLPVPKVKGGQGQPVTSPASDNLKRYVSGLVKRAEAVRGGKVDPKDDNML